MKLLRGKRVGPRNPVARGFSLFRRTTGRKKPSRASAERGPSSRSTSTGSDAFVSRPEDAAAGLEAQARRPEGRETGRWPAVPLLAARRLLAFPSVARLQTVVSRVPSGTPRLHPQRRGTGPGQGLPSGPSHSSGVGGPSEKARIAGTDPRGTGGWQRVGRSPTRPVLKHGPRSLTCARVNGS